MRISTHRQSGFSVIELVMVVVTVGMLAAVAVPSLMGSKEAAENTAVVSNLRAMHTNQIVHRSTKGRFARLTELNQFSGNVFGSVSGTTLYQKGWTYLMSPTPTNTSLRSGYQIIAYKLRGGRVHTAYLVAQDGAITTLVSSTPTAQPTSTATPSTEVKSTSTAIQRN